MSFAFPADWFNSQRNVQRAAAVTLLLLLHFLALSVLMTSRQQTAPIPRAVREIMISFPIFRPRPVPRRTSPAKIHTRARRESSPVFTLPPNAIAPASPPQSSGIGHSLFGCDPAAMKNPDEQAGCGALAAKPLPEEVGMPKRSHVVQTARWMNELKIKQSHRRVPCVGVAPGPGGSAGFMVDFICVGKGLINGFGEPK